MWIASLFIFLQVSRGTIVSAVNPCSDPKAPGGVWQDGCLVKTCNSGTVEESLADECVELIEKKVEKILGDKLAEKGIECPAGGPTEAGKYQTPAGPQALLIGPSYGSPGKSELLSLPDLRPLDCKIPVFPDGEYYGYVGRSTSEGVLMCGGFIQDRREFTTSCYLLTSSGYQDMPGLIYETIGATSLVTPLGLWVTGGNDRGVNHVDTTEIWSNNQSQPHVRLPEGLSGHCLTSLNNTHQLLTGGSPTDIYPTAAAYLYSEQDGFTRIEDMKTARYGHGCSVINDNTVIVAGGRNNYKDLSSTEYLDLNSFKWVEGPELPEALLAQILGPEELGPEIGGHLLFGGKKIFKLKEEGLTQTRQWTKVREMKNSMAGAKALVVNQNMFC